MNFSTCRTLFLIICQPEWEIYYAEYAKMAKGFSCCRATKQSFYGIRIYWFLCFMALCCQAEGVKSAVGPVSHPNRLCNWPGRFIWFLWATTSPFHWKYVPTFLSTWWPEVQHALMLLLFCNFSMRKNKNISPRR